MSTVNDETSSSQETPQEQSPYFFAEIAPDKILVRPETLDLHDGIELERAIWEPLLGGELLDVWDTILTNPGDEIYIKGSLVTKLALGGYVVDKKTGLADPALRSDCDIVIDKPEILDRVKSIAFPSGGIQTNVALSGKLGNISVDFVSEERIRDIDVSGLNELLDILETNNSKNEDLLDRIKETADVIAEASMRAMLVYDNLYPSESMSLRLSRNEDKSLSVFFEDPGKLLSRHEVIAGLEHSKDQGYFFGVAFEQPNTHSVPSLYVEALKELHEVEFHRLSPVFWAINPLARIIKSSAELDVDIVGIDDASYFPELYTLADRLVSGDLKVTVKSEDGEVIDIKERLRTNVQEFFARGCASNMTIAFDAVFANFPFGDFISPDLGQMYKEYHEKLPVTTLANVFTFGKRENDLPYTAAFRTLAAGLQVIDVPDIPAMHMLFRYRSLVTKYYDDEVISYQMQPLGGTEHSGRAIYFPDAKKNPEGMSEIMAMILVAAEWDTVKDINKIRAIVDQWKPKGQLAVSWKRLDYNWEMGLDESKIVSFMNKFKEGINE